MDCQHQVLHGKALREVDELRTAVARLTKLWNEEMENTAAWKVRTAAAEAEVERLRANLAALAVDGNGTPWTRQVARHALAEFQKAEAGWVEPTKVLLAEVERLRGLLTEWIPRHSAACCTPTPELGSFPPGPFLPKWCRCNSLSKRSRAALEVVKP
jgi:hypothetical protein